MTDFQNRSKEMSMKHVMKYLFTPMAIALAFLAFAATSEPAAKLLLGCGDGGCVASAHDPSIKAFTVTVLPSGHIALEDTIDQIDLESILKPYLDDVVFDGACEIGVGANHDTPANEGCGEICQSNMGCPSGCDCFFANPPTGWGVCVPDS